jgi:hypothetical protein
MRQHGLKLENHCRAGFQPCHFMCEIKNALAAGSWKGCCYKHPGLVGIATIETPAAKAGRLCGSQWHC